eukprot:361140-Chlamydomonas_euryale.AAC.2
MVNASLTGSRCCLRACSANTSAAPNPYHDMALAAVTLDVLQALDVLGDDAALRGCVADRVSAGTA